MGRSGSMKQWCSGSGHTDSSRDEDYHPAIGVVQVVIERVRRRVHLVVQSVYATYTCM